MAISIAKLAIHVTTETGQMIAGFSKAKSLVNGFAASMGSGGSGGLSVLAGAATGAALLTNAIAAVGAAMVATAVLGVRFASSMQQAEQSLRGFTKSSATAKEMLKDLFQFAATTPFGVTEVVAASRTMMAMGSESQDVMAQMQMLGDVASGSGQPLNELAMVFGQVMQAGRLTGNELRQFNERGVPVLTELANMLGVTKTEIRGLVEEGKISSEQVVRAFDRMTTGSGIMAGQMALQAQTLAGQWARFWDNFSALAGDAMGDFVKNLTLALRTASDLIEMIRGTTGVTKEKMASDRAAYLERIAQQQAELDAANAAKESAKQAAEQQKRRMETMKNSADQMAKSLRTPAEVWRDTMKEISELMNAGLIDWDTYTRAIERANDELDKATVKKQELSKPASPIAAVLRGTAAARSAEFAAESAMKEQLNEAKRQTELAKAARDQRNQMLVELRKQGVTVKEVNL